MSNSSNGSRRKQVEEKILSLFDSAPNTKQDEGDLEESYFEEEGTNWYKDDKAVHFSEEQQDGTAKGKRGKLQLKADFDLQADDPKYAGKASSRQAAFSFNDNIDEFDEDGNDEDSDEGDMASNSDDDDAFGFNQFEASSSDEDEGFSIDSNSMQATIHELEKQDKIDVMKVKVDTEKEQAKAKHTLNQKTIWDAVLNVRIHQQKLLNDANRLPQLDMMDYFKRRNNDVAVISEEISIELHNTLASLMSLSEKLIEGHEEMSSHVKQQKGEQSGAVAAQHVDDDEEAFKHKDLSSYWHTRITNHEQSWEGYRNEVLEKWHNKTQVSSQLSQQTKFKAINQNIVSQMERHLSEQKERLISRTQTLRSFDPTTEPVLGKKRKINETNNNDDADGNNKQPKDYEATASSEIEKDVEIFDDTDFYQQLLKQLIESSVSRSSDGLDLTRAWLATKPDKKRRKVVDRKASKGRKIRYTSHEKLVNFMPSIEKDIPEYTEELYEHLFR